MNTANSRQVGGDHYSADQRRIQHWDLMAICRAQYLPAQITRYVDRHKRKNGQEDLEKALHYAQKTREVQITGVQHLPPALDRGAEMAIERYIREARLDGAQASIFRAALLRPDDADELVRLVEGYLVSTYAERTDLFAEVARLAGVSRSEAQASLLALSRKGVANYAGQAADSETAQMRAYAERQSEAAAQNHDPLSDDTEADLQSQLEQEIANRNADR